MRRIESTVRVTGCRVVVSAVMTAAMTTLGLAYAPVAGAVPAANPNPHVSTYVGTAGTVITNVGTDTCAGCHRAHNASNPLLLNVPTDKKGNGSQADLCFTCHDGTGASTDVKTEYLSGQQNDPANGNYYRHDATAMPTTHTLAVDNEFGGVLNRHSECTDCHNPHATQSGDTTTPAAGVAWPASARLIGISFVTVNNATTPESYTFNAGTGTSPTYEYQLCFKCHSNFTTLPTNNTGKKSRDFLDAGAEFNPANAAFHPVEAAGKNLTTAMGLSLSTALTTATAARIPNRWASFTTSSTVRCTNCHSDELMAATAASPSADLAPHTSSYRGILSASYNDTTINGNSTTLNAQGSSTFISNFSLCFMCHTDTSFISNGNTDAAGDAATNFKSVDKNLHRFHVTGLGGGSGDIDTAGSGRGNALCAECHFRPHSTEFPVNSQASNQRLVSFSPNVSGINGQPPRWTVSGNTVSCYLTCHGQQHNPETYTWTP